MSSDLSSIPVGKKWYFASDFHLGIPNAEESRKRERFIIKWLDECKQDAAVIFLVGDIFDFWFEYHHTIPKGFIRFQGKLAELVDAGIQIIFFTGNHDMWMFDYFTEELAIPIYRSPQEFTVNGQKLLVGHGDGLGPGDHTYKIIKKVFANKACQWAFQWLHPNVGMAIANYWSKKSRHGNSHRDNGFEREKEWLLLYCEEMEKKEHFDIYLFGHRHLPLEEPIGENSIYVNLGEWVYSNTYAVFDGHKIELKKFQ